MQKNNLNKAYLFNNSVFFANPNDSVFVKDNLLCSLDTNKNTSNQSQSFSPLIKHSDFDSFSSSSVAPLFVPIHSSIKTILESYKTFSAFSSSNKNLSISQFEKAVSTNLSLCSFFKTLDTAYIEQYLDLIENYLPFISNVFLSPITHLKEFEHIVEVDRAKKTGRKSIRHLMQHSENWFVGTTLSPKKILNTSYEDDYSIYENVVFVKLIDNILFSLNSFIFDIESALFSITSDKNSHSYESGNHPLFFKSLGTLYSTAFHNFDSNKLEQLVSKLRSIVNIISFNLNSVLYKSNANKKLSTDSIKKTNIFSMHKDYKEIYNLYKKLAIKENDYSALTQKNNSTAINSYFSFLQYLAIFSLLGFDFTAVGNLLCNKDGLLDFSFKCLSYTARLKSVFVKPLEQHILQLEISSKTKKIEFAFIPILHIIKGDKQAFCSSIANYLSKHSLKADKYIFCQPLNKDTKFFTYNAKSQLNKDINYASIPLSLDDIASFKRIQKIILEGIVRVDSASTICPFCKSSLTSQKDSTSCLKCKLVVLNTACSSCNKQFSATKNSKNSVLLDFASVENGDSQFFKHEKTFNFRNATNIVDSKFECPHCLALN